MAWICARPRRPALLGTRPLLAYALIIVSVAAMLSLHAGICVGGLGACSGGPKELKGPDTIVQLRRDVAARLIKVAADLRSGHTVSVVEDLEATAALLDSRYIPRVQGPPPPRPGFAPSPLPGQSPAPSTMHGDDSPPGWDLWKYQNQDLGHYDLWREGRGGGTGRGGGRGEGEGEADKVKEGGGGKRGTEGHSAMDAKGSRDDPAFATPPPATNATSRRGGEREGGKGPSEGGERGHKEEKWNKIEEEAREREEEAGRRNQEDSQSIPAYADDFLQKPLPGAADLGIDVEGSDTLPSLRSQVTVLLDGCGSPSGLVTLVVRQAKAAWPGVGVVVGVDEERQGEEADEVENLADVTVMLTACEKWRRGDLSALAESAATPFVLVLDGVTGITEDLDLLRLLSVAIGLRGLGVEVVGGAERGRDGSWDYVCTKLTTRNYRLTLQDGYDFSRAACVFCDVTSSSFLASTRVVRELPFDLNLPHRAQAIDWALRLQRRGALAMTCPDVMFHSGRTVRQREIHREVDRSCLTKEDRKQARAQAWAVKRQYRKLAQKWELNVVTFSNGTSVEYTCREFHFDCNAYFKVRHYLLPPCCLRAKNKMFNTIDIVAKENHVPYEISSGTLLGAVKFKDGIPWDFDDDAHYRNADVEKLRRNTQRMRRLGLSPRFSKQVGRANASIVSNYITASSLGGFSLDLWGVQTMPSLGTPEALAKFPDNLVCFEHGHVPMSIRMAKALIQNQTLSTKHVSPSCYLISMLRVGSNWLPGPWNPGKKALHHYGDNLYRHEAHWRWNNIERPGWAPCPHPGHHSCLDLHPLDGSIPFL